jgi:hypothetical protein
VKSGTDAGGSRRTQHVRNVVTTLARRGTGASHTARDGLRADHAGDVTHVSVSGVAGAGVPSDHRTVTSNGTGTADAGVGVLTHVAAIAGVVARLAEEVGLGSRGDGWCGDGRGGTGRQAGIVDRIVVLILVGAGPEPEEEHLDDHLVHGRILSIVGSHQRDVRRLDVEVPRLGHCEVELSEAEEHAALPIEPF